jgi:hypothetical protein
MLPTKFRFIWPSGFTWPLQAILVSDWFISKKLSPLKPHGQMNRNLVGSILGRFSIQDAHLVPIRLQTWPPQTILVSDWLISKKIFSSEAANGYRGKDFLEINQSETRIFCGGHV